MNLYDKKNIVKQCFVEFFGTGLIVFCGTSCTAASKLTNIHFNLFEISVIWGIGVSIAVYFSFSVSGAHLNPAITIFFWLFSRFNTKKVLPYITSQIFGAFFFTVLVYYFYYDVFLLFENKNHVIRGTQDSLYLASIFCVYPKNNHFFYDFILEIIFTCLFMILLLQLHSKKNALLYNSSIKPILIGMIVTIINLSISPLNGISLNPARDLGPRIFLSITGWGILSFTGGNGHILYFLIPIFGPILGINLGGWIYNVLFNNHFFKSK